MKRFFLWGGMGLWAMAFGLGGHGESRTAGRQAGAQDLKRPVAVIPTLSVTEPTPTINWLSGDGHLNKVAWTKAGPQADRVGIFLFNADCTARNRTLVADTPNDGEEMVALPTGVPPGTYTVRVATSDGRLWDCGPPFGILKSPFIITIPTPGTFWSTVGEFSVGWSTTQNRGVQLDIFLRRPGDMVGTVVLKSRTSNDGTERVTIPAGVSPGDYLVEIYPLTGSWVGYPFFSGLIHVHSGR